MLTKFTRLAAISVVSDIVHMRLSIGVMEGTAILGSRSHGYSIEPEAGLYEGELDRRIELLSASLETGQMIVNPGEADGVVIQYPPLSPEDAQALREAVLQVWTPEVLDAAQKRVDAMNAAAEAERIEREAREADERAAADADMDRRVAEAVARRA